MAFNKKSRSVKMMAVCMIITMMLPSTIIFGQTDQAVQKDYYYEGQAAAKIDYSGGGAMVGGLASGTLFGLIGWGVGYLIISGKDAEVPYHYLSNLNATQQMQFKDGYKTYVKKTRKGNFNIGAGIGTLVAVILVANSSE